jgi:pimeloyl-ACP methyl ester carboxylesterase
LGGPYVSLYTGLYGDQVAGLVYVDASHPDQLKRFEAVLGKKGGMKWLDKVLGKLSWTGIPRLVASFARKRGATSAVPPRTREISLAFLPTSLGPMLSERDAFSTTLDEAGAYRNLGARPVVVLTHGKPGTWTDMSKAEAEKLETTWREMQEDIATWSSHGTQTTISDAGHYIPNDDPDAVIAAIRKVVDDVRSTN